MRHVLPIALLIFATGCAGSGEAASPAAPALAAAPSPAPAPGPGPVVPPPGVRVSAPACGYGGSAPAVAVFLDLQTERALTGVSVSFTLADPVTGAPSGVSRAPETLVISPVDRGLLDFSTQGTRPFDGALAAGTTTRLEYFAGLGDDPAGAVLAMGGPLRVNVVVHANEGVFTATCDTAQMWPSS